MQKTANAVMGYGPGSPSSTPGSPTGPAPKITPPKSMQGPTASTGPGPGVGPSPALPATAPGTPQLNTSPANMTMTSGPIPPTSATSTPEPGPPGIMGPQKGPAPKIAEDAKAFLRRKLRGPDRNELPEPPSLKPPKPPKPPKAFAPRKPGGAFMRSGSSQGTT